STLPHPSSRPAARISKASPRCRSERVTSSRAPTAPRAGRPCRSWSPRADPGGRDRRRSPPTPVAGARPRAKPSAASLSQGGPVARREVGDVLLEVQDLNVDYLTLNGAVRAVSDASFTLHRGEILGLAGESGSGKSTLTTALLRLQRDPAVTAGGKVLFHEEDGSVVDLVPRTDKELLHLRWDKLAI